MTIEWIEGKDGYKVQIVYGFGKIQRARAIYVKHLPESMRRAQLANPDITDKELISKASPEEITEYTAILGSEICRLVLNVASDWDKAKVSVDEYVDSHLPEDVGFEIVRRVRDAINVSALEEEKKSP